MEATSSHPGWVQVNNGILKGTNLFLDISSIAFWAGEMANGNYDQPLFDQIIANTALEGKVVWDVGAHIGYHSLMLAKMVGDTGQVIAFEPNPYNISRFNMHLEKNPELASRITLNSLAISNKDGEAQFEFSPSIDIGTSSGSHLKGASTPYAEEIYKDFGRMMVNVAQIDTLVADMKTSPPSVIKVDVEGAECELLEGARNVLQTHRPILFIEIHSAANVFHVQNFLNEMGYRISLIEDAHESPMRCFIMAKPRSKQI
jgi:FkbM family methyltransferase